MVFAFAGDSTITKFFAISILHFFLCSLCVLCVSVVNECLIKTTTETQRTQRLHRESNTYSRFTKHLPGSARTSSRISRESSAAVSSEIGSLLLSKSQSTCAGSSGVNNLKTHVSADESPSG